MSTTSEPGQEIEVLHEIAAAARKLPLASGAGSSGDSLTHYNR